VRLREVPGRASLPLQIRADGSCYGLFGARGATVHAATANAAVALAAPALAVASATHALAAAATTVATTVAVSTTAHAFATAAHTVSAAAHAFATAAHASRGAPLRPRLVHRRRLVQYRRGFFVRRAHHVARQHAGNERAAGLPSRRGSRVPGRVRTLRPRSQPLPTGIALSTPPTVTVAATPIPHAAAPLARAASPSGGRGRRGVRLRRGLVHLYRVGRDGRRLLVWRKNRMATEH